jgi:hypothetical protein
MLAVTVAAAGVYIGKNSHFASGVSARCDFQNTLLGSLAIEQRKGKKLSTLIPEN